VFGRFRTEGRRYRHGPLWCSYIPDGDAVPPRVAYAIGRSVGTAVTRNRLRRRLRAAVAAEATAFAPGWYLVGAQPAAVSLDHAALRAAVRSFAEQARS
jgi:ribonuclease P protein component